MPTTEDEASKAKRRRRNRIINAVLYFISACLILFGIYLILLDQTNLFNHNTAEIPDVTFPPEEAWAPTAVPETQEPSEIPSDAPLPSPPPDDPDESEEPQVTAEPTPVPTEPPPNTPVSVYFADHGISVKVVPVGVNEKGEMDTVPKHDVAGWYQPGPAPNQSGNCIIAGHNRWHGRKGLFSILHDGLKVGDRIIVTMEDGSTLFYTVDKIKRYHYDAVPDSVMELDGETRLTLITCLGDYSHILHMSETRVVAVCKPFTIR